MQTINDRYTFDPKTDELGKGGFGRVFKASDTLLNRDVVLKMVEKGSLPDKYSLVQEISRVIGFNHPNLVRYYDAIIMKTTNQFGEEIEYQVGVMEYVSGGDLRSLMAKNLPAGQIREIVQGILDGLGYLHQHNIIHRDIKPPNILLQPEAGKLVPKICDFGISKVAGSEATALSNVIGTFEYMSPEQLGNNPDQMIRTNADIWSLGVLLYEMLTGELPFGSRRSGTTDAKIIGNILVEEIPDKIREIPQPFRKMIELSLEKDNQKRIQDTGTLSDLLEDKQPLEPVPKAQPKPKPVPEAQPQGLFGNQQSRQENQQEASPNVEPRRSPQPEVKSAPNPAMLQNQPLAVAALAMAFVGFLIPIFAIVSIILAFMAQGKIKKEPEKYKGQGFIVGAFATSGLVIFTYLIFFLAALGGGF